MIYKSEKLEERFDQLFKILSSEHFLNKEGLGNEVPFFIHPFNPKEQNLIDKNIFNLIKRLENYGTYVLEINLYDLAIELLKKENDFEEIIANEATMDKDKLYELITSLLDIEEVITPSIKTKIKEVEFNVLFITGVGPVFPYIRSHSILEHLQSVVTEQPTLLFLPGEYTYSEKHGSTLDLFGKKLFYKYYRAFNINDYKI